MNKKDCFWKGFSAFLLKEANGKYFQKVLEFKRPKF